jgi:hypothetical protein
MKPINTLVLRIDNDSKKEFAAVVKRAIYEVEPRLIVPEVSSIHEVVDSQAADVAR